MSEHIIPDDLYDGMELIDDLMNELGEWIDIRKTRMYPWQAVTLLGAAASRIAYIHAVDIEEVPMILEKANEIGRIMAHKDLQKK